MPRELERAGAERFLAIRRLFALEDVPLREATHLLGVLAERSLPAGSRLATLGAPLDAAWFVLEGALKVETRTDRAILAEDARVGVMELLAGATAGLDVEVVRDAVVLEISRIDLEALVMDDLEIMTHTLRSFARELLRLEADEPRALVSPPLLGDAPVGYVERLRFVHDLLAPIGIGVASLAELSHELDESEISGILAPRGSLVHRVHFVLRGALRCGPRTIGVGGMFGAFEALAERPLAADLTADSGTRVLTCAIATVLDVIEDDPGLCFAWVRSLAERLVGLGVTSCTPAPPHTD